MLDLGRRQTLRQLERGIVRKDLALQLPQLRPRLEAELVQEKRSSSLIRIEGVCLATRAVERKHQLRAQSLPERMLGHERFELRDERGMTALGEVSVEPLLEACKRELLDPRNLVLCERLVREVSQRNPPLQPKSSWFETSSANRSRSSSPGSTRSS